MGWRMAGRASPRAARAVNAALLRGLGAETLTDRGDGVRNGFAVSGGSAQFARAPRGERSRGGSSGSVPHVERAEARRPLDTGGAILLRKQYRMPLPHSTACTPLTSSPLSSPGRMRRARRRWDVAGPQARHGRDHEAAHVRTASAANPTGTARAVEPPDRPNLVDHSVRRADRAVVARDAALGGMGANLEGVPARCEVSKERGRVGDSGRTTGPGSSTRARGVDLALGDDRNSPRSARSHHAPFVTSLDRSPGFDRAAYCARPSGPRFLRVGRRGVRVRRHPCSVGQVRFCITRLETCLAVRLAIDYRSRPRPRAPTWRSRGMPGLASLGSR